MAKRQRGNGERSITQRADGRWMARISLGGYGKHRRVDTLYGATRDELVKALTKALRDKDTGKTLGRKAPKLSAFADTWMTSAAHALKPSTCDFYRDHLDHHVLPLLGRHRVDRLYVSTQLGHTNSTITLKTYDVECVCQCVCQTPGQENLRRALCVKCVEIFGEPRRNRTFNPQIKSPTIRVCPRPLSAFPRFRGSPS